MADHDHQLAVQHGPSGGAKRVGKKMTIEDLEKALKDLEMFKRREEKEKKEYEKKKKQHLMNEKKAVGKALQKTQRLANQRMQDVNRTRKTLEKTETEIEKQNAKKTAQASKFVESVDKLRRRRNDTEQMLSAKQMEVGEARGRLEMIEWVLDGAHQSGDTTLSPAEREVAELHRQQLEADRVAEEQAVAEEQDYQNQLRTDTEALRMKKLQLENENDRLHNELEEVRVLSTRARAAAQEALLQEGESFSKASAISAAAAKAAVTPTVPPRAPSRAPSSATSPLIFSVPVSSPKPAYIMPAEASRPPSPLRHPVYPSGHGGAIYGGHMVGVSGAMYGGNMVAGPIAIGQQTQSAAVYSGTYPLPSSYAAPPPPPQSAIYGMPPAWQQTNSAMVGTARSIAGSPYDGAYPAASPRIVTTGGYEGGLSRSMSDSQLARGVLGGLPYAQSQHAGVLVPYTNGYPSGSGAYASGYLDRSVGTISDRPAFAYPSSSILPSHHSADHGLGLRPSRTGSLPATAPRPLPAPAPGASGANGESTRLQGPIPGGEIHSEFSADFPQPRSLGSAVHKVTAKALREYREQHRGSVLPS